MNEKQVILAVDDEATNRMLLEGVLGKDYVVLTAASGAEAIEICTNKHVDLVLLDVMMPEMDGYEVCKCLKGYDDTKNIPVIFISALGETKNEKMGLELGAIDYIVKPLVAPILKARVRTHLELKQYRDHLEQMVEERTGALVWREKKERLILQDQFSHLEQLAISLAHEINQPLTYINTIIQSTIDKLEENKIDPQKMIEKFNKTVIQVNRIIQLTDHLRALRWAGETIFEQVDLAVAIDDAFAFMSDQIIQKNITIHCHIPDNIPTILGNMSKLQQVFINLTRNSIAALENRVGGEISVSLTSEPDKVIVHFSDNGSGMSPEVKNKVFEAFFTTKGRDQGAGIGLGVVLDIVHEHEGTITCESECRVGTTFTLTLPVQR